ncbi:MAG: hypothetical protein Q9195_002119 [Heterodermia aff. obscurata]
MSSSPLVMITGGNGFVGYAVLVGALKAGYRVRASVRRQDAVDKICTGQSVQDYLSEESLTFIIIPDNSKPGAYFEAVKECSYIIHVASPLASKPGDLVSQAVAGHEAILEAAEATPSIKRIVFTSSTCSIRPFERVLLSHPANQAILAGEGDKVPVLTAETIVPTQPPLPDSASRVHCYTNSKIATANLTREYSSAHPSSHFSIVNIIPGLILGPEELSHSKAEAFKGSNMILGWLFAELNISPLFGLPLSDEAPVLSETVHLDDVVEGHVKALDEEKIQGQMRSFLLCSHSPTGPVLMDAVEIVKRELPKEVEEGKIPFAGKLDVIPSKFDATPSERDLLGHPFIPFEKQVTDTVSWFVHLKDT